MTWSKFFVGAFSKKVRFRGKERSLPLWLKAIGRRNSETHKDDESSTSPVADRHSGRTMDPVVLLDLPDDVLLLVLASVDVQDLINCGEVCVFLKDLIEADVRLQYKMELAVNGMIDGPPSAGLTVSERLQKLREHNARFCAADFSCHSDFGFGKGGPERAEAGPLRTGRPDSFGSSVSYLLLEHHHGNHADTHAVVYAPPSACEGLGERRWTIPLPRQGLRRISAVDVSQDLMIAHEGVGNSWDARVYLLSLQHLTSHPGTMHPVVHIVSSRNVLPSAPPDAVRITEAQVYGRYLAVRMPYHGDRVLNSLEVWDWRRGSLIWHGHLTAWSTFTFVDNAFLVVSSNARAMGPYRVQIHRFVDSQPDPGCMSSSAIVKLELPPNTIYCDIMDTCSPSPPTPPASAVFWPDPALRMVAMRLHLSRSGGIFSERSLDANCILLIPSATLRKQVERATASQTSTVTQSRLGGSSSLVVSWRDWGSHGSALLKNAQLSYRRPWQDYYFFPFGSRIALLVRDHEHVRMATFDLNPLAATHGPHAGCSRFPRETLLEDLSNVERQFRSASLLRTTYPRSVCRGPTLSDHENLLTIATHQNGFTLVYKGSIYLSYMAGFKSYSL